MVEILMSDEMSSVAAFVEGGIQDACEDACSICLEEFSPRWIPMVTFCNHEFHFQCINDWYKRSIQCPMCWQFIRLKNPIGQELLDLVQPAERLRYVQSPVGAMTSIDHRIHSSREEGGGQSHTGSFMVFSSGHGQREANRQGLSFGNRNSSIQDDRVLLNFQSLSESVKSKWSMVSAKYKDTIAKSTRVWKGKLFACNSPMMMADCAPLEGSNSSRRRRREVTGGSSSSRLCCISRQQQQLQSESDRSSGYTTIQVRRNQS